MATRAFAGQVASLVQVDLLPKMIDLARAASTAPPKEGQVEFVRDDAVHFAETTPRKFDLVVMHQALNFFEDPERLFAAISRIMADDGMFIFDIDGRLRWCVIEALNGHIENALTIARDGFDRDRNIVGAEYRFWDGDEIEALLRRARLLPSILQGIGYVAPYLHVFNSSAEFLSPANLDPRAARYLDDREFEKLVELDRHFEGCLEKDAAGWLVFGARKLA
ncbi:SAM-dependent methyltransferase [Sphingobium sp. B11D3A]|nr:SAM-dependent methyltransferase [Sphingobium sp. B11D3A]